MRIGIVAEGSTDLAILRAVVEHLLGEEAVVTPLQPQQSPLGDHGPDGSGWRGVRGWCRGDGHRASPIDGGLVDVLLVHLDADVALRCDFVAEEGVDRQPCPPPEATVDPLRQVVHRWLAAADRADVVLAVPSMATDTWVLVASFGQWTDHLTDVECDPDPALRMTRRPFKLYRTKDGRPKKSVRECRMKHAPVVAGQWGSVTAACGQALRFELDLIAATGRP